MQAAANHFLPNTLYAEGVELHSPGFPGFAGVPWVIAFSQTVP